MTKNKIGELIFLQCCLGLFLCCNETRLLRQNKDDDDLRLDQSEIIVTVSPVKGGSVEYILVSENLLLQRLAALQYPAGLSGGLDSGNSIAGDGTTLIGIELILGQPGETILIDKEMEILVANVPIRNHKVEERIKKITQPESSGHGYVGKKLEVSLEHALLLLIGADGRLIAEPANAPAEYSSTNGNYLVTIAPDTFARVSIEGGTHLIVILVIDLDLSDSLVFGRRSIDSFPYYFEPVERIEPDQIPDDPEIRDITTDLDDPGNEENASADDSESADVLQAQTPPSDKFVTNSFIFIPAGNFTMGDNLGIGQSNERPAHPVSLSPYFIQKLEVSSEEYRRCVDSGGCSAYTVGSDSAATYRDGSWSHPMNFVTWSQAQVYCQWIGGDLPTEAQWEYAARKDGGKKYPWGDTDPGSANTDLANCAENACSDGFPYTAPVDSFPGGASSFGLLNMLGNVWEWTLDSYTDGFFATSKAAGLDPVNDVQSNNRVLRGDAYYHDGSEIHISDRAYYDSSTSLPELGFRCMAPVESSL